MLKCKLYQQEILKTQTTKTHSRIFLQLDFCQLEVEKKNEVKLSPSKDPFSL